MRHYEVVYLIHEKHDEEVGSVNEKVQGHPVFLNPLLPSVNHFNIISFLLYRYIHFEFQFAYILVSLYFC